MKNSNKMRPFFTIFLLTVSVYRIGECCKGCVNLDEYNFDKIISRFEAVFVKFDVAYPYGEKHDIYTKLAEELASNPHLIFAEVGVKDYGDKENEKLALKYDIKKDDLPAIRLFIRKEPSGKPVAKLDKEDQWTLDNLRNLIRDNTNIYIGLPGCVEKFDKLAIEFINSDSKQQKLEQAQKIASELLETHEKEAANVYVKYMQKIVENGANFVKQELSRLTKILKEAKINEKKKESLANRLNVLRSFSLPKDEL